MYVSVTKVATNVEFVFLVKENWKKTIAITFVNFTDRTL